MSALRGHEGVTGVFVITRRAAFGVDIAMSGRALRLLLPEAKRFMPDAF